MRGIDCFGNALTWGCGVGETNARKDYGAEERIVYGEWEPRKAWRPALIALPTCLRTVTEDAFYHQLDGELSPSAGGPPV